MDSKLYTNGARLSLTIADVVRENPQTSFPSGEYPEVAGYLRYAPTAKPYATPEQNIIEESPALVNGEFQQVWTVVPARPEEIAQRLTDRKAEMKAKAADVRWRRETGGIMVNGMPISTAPESQTKLVSVLVIASQNPAFEVNWKGSDGRFYPMTSAQILEMVYAVRQHIQAAFDWEGQIVAAIDSATTHAELDAIHI